MLPPLSKAPLFRPDVCPPGSLPADTRGEASYLSRRLVSKASRLELDPALSWRGVGRTSMIPYVPYIPPERIHLAASGRYNPILDLTESLTSALDANAPASPPASPPRSASPQSAAASPQAAAAAGAAEGEAPAADASSPAEAPAPDALPPLVPQLLHSDIEREIERKAQVSAPPPPPASHLPHEHAHRLPSSPSRACRSQPDGWTPLMCAVRSGRLSDVSVHISPSRHSRLSLPHLSSCSPAHRCACCCRSAPIQTHETGTATCRYIRQPSLGRPRR